MPEQRNRPRIYLAGPEVFLPNVTEVGAAKVAICDEAGLEGVFPLDAAVDTEGLSPHEQARRIFEADEGLMHDCDAAIANLTPFRGVSMDPGTSYEMGFMRALGRPVFGYTNVAADLAARSQAFRRTSPGQPDFDATDVEIENFGLAENLMIAMAIEACGGKVVRHAISPEAINTDLQGFRDCVRQAAEHFASDRKQS